MTTTASAPRPATATGPRPVAARTDRFTESVIREMTRLIQLHYPTDGINLAQGFPDFPAPRALKDAAIAAIQDVRPRGAFAHRAAIVRIGLLAEAGRRGAGQNPRAPPPGAAQDLGRARFWPLLAARAHPSCST